MAGPLTGQESIVQLSACTIAGAVQRTVGEARHVDVAHLRVAAVAERGNRTLGGDGDAGGTALTDARR